MGQAGIRSPRSLALKAKDINSVPNRNHKSETFCMNGYLLDILAANLYTPKPKKDYCFNMHSIQTGGFELLKVVCVR